MLSLSQNFGTIITSLTSEARGGIQSYGIDVGARLKINEKHFLNLTVGYKYQMFESLNNSSGFDFYRRGTAKYLGLNLGYSFKK